MTRKMPAVAVAVATDAAIAVATDVAIAVAGCYLLLMLLLLLLLRLSLRALSDGECCAIGPERCWTQRIAPPAQSKCPSS